MKYRAALFDMDGVILDSESLHEAAFRATLSPYGHDLSAADYKTYFAGKTDKVGIEQYFESVNESVELSRVESEKTKAYLEIAQVQLQAYPGIVTLIRDLAKKIPLALVTGSSRVEVEIALETLSITDCFSVIISAEDVKQGKPNPEGYLRAAKLLNTQIDQCIIVEDSPSGIKAARDAGAYCIAVTNTHTDKELEGANLIADRLKLELF